MTRPAWRDAAWRKSSRSSGGANNCVEVAARDEVAAIRDSKNPDGPVLEFQPPAFAAFIGTIKTGRLDLH
jgi:Domain of unknown function (DUF397)